MCEKNSVCIHLWSLCYGCYHHHHQHKITSFFVLFSPSLNFFIYYTWWERVPLILLCALSLLGFSKKAGNARYCQEKKSTKLKSNKKKKKKREKEYVCSGTTKWKTKGGREKNCKSVTFCAHATVELTRKMVNWSRRSVKEEQESWITITYIFSNPKIIKASIFSDIFCLQWHFKQLSSVTFSVSSNIYSSCLQQCFLSPVTFTAAVFSAVLCLQWHLQKLFQWCFISPVTFTAAVFSAVLCLQ